ncbi:M66 family metalloprotease [Photobacterium damselae]|uniref:M66 family metalloprotease n=1 Tax=Photobacterium damselae TaxID=38293 RepID=UPI004068421E
MKKTYLSALIATLVSSSSIAGSVNQEEVAMTDVSKKTFERIELLHQMAENNENTFIKDGNKYLKYNGKDYRLNQDNYPKFPFVVGGDDSIYRNVFDFVDNSWHFEWYDGGFYLLQPKIGNLDYSNGCFIEYYPAYKTNPMVQRLAMDGCKWTAPSEIQDFNIASISDQGVTINWKDEQSLGDISLVLKRNNQIVKTFQPEKSHFYIGSLEPNTEYSVELKRCNGDVCTDTQIKPFTTLPIQLGFNDEQPLKNHLQGSFVAELGFAQTGTTTAPYGNDINSSPDIVINRGALLIVKPENKNINQLWVDVQLDGQSVAILPMNSPSELPKTDQPNNEKSRVIYSHNAWTLPLPWNWVKPGLSLHFTDNQGNSGDIPASSFVFGGAPELVIQNIDMGMLTTPKDKNAMLKYMQQLTADYFQKIPVSKLIMADYTAAHFTKITLPNGKVYTEHSDDTGGIYSGDMREDIGKALVSTGINNANFGIVDSAGTSQHHNRHFNHITAHSNVGIYANGYITHGLSGGGGIVTLSSTTGNQWSHELGHNFGLGHYPHMASTHDEESGWGWDARYGRFIGNLNWTADPFTNDKGGEIAEPFKGEFGYLKDAMAGGYSQGLISRYTLHHPTSARRIQQNLNGANIIDLENSTTGYKIWNQEQQKYVDAQVSYSAPIQKGVPVTTILGIYDPLNKNPSQVYPLVHSNYGNLFDLPKSDLLSEFQLEGWHSATSLTIEQKQSNIWATIKMNNELVPLCQFSYTADNGDSAQFIGGLNSDTDRCEATDNMYWTSNNDERQLISEQGMYSLVSKYGEGNISYTPTASVGEVQLCQLNSDNDEHDGAGYISGGYCKQLDGVKHTNGNAWSYSANRSHIMRPSYINQRKCTLTVSGENGIENFALTPTRLHSSQSNKFHINIPGNQSIDTVSVACSDIDGTHVLDTLHPQDKSADVNKLLGPVIVGQEYGYSSLQTSIPHGWFKHLSNSFNFNKLDNYSKSLLATMPVNDERLPVCRFNKLINGEKQTVFGYVETLSDTEYRCTGGDSITVNQDGNDVRLESAVNDFEWLSLSDPEHVGERANAMPNDEADLCVMTKSGYYGAGFVNNIGQCTQVSGVKWSNGSQWTFSSGHAGYTLM